MHYRLTKLYEIRPGKLSKKKAGEADIMEGGEMSFLKKANKFMQHRI